MKNFILMIISVTLLFGILSCVTPSGYSAIPDYVLDPPVASDSFFGVGYGRGEDPAMAMDDAYWAAIYDALRQREVIGAIPQSYAIDADGGIWVLMMMERPDFRTTAFETFERNEDAVFTEFKADQKLSPPDKPAEIDSDLPEWVLNPPTSDDTYYAAGYGKDRDLFTAMEKARRAANLELVKHYYELEIESVDYEQDDKGGFWALVEIENRDYAFTEFKAAEALEALEMLDFELKKQDQTDQAEE